MMPETSASIALWAEETFGAAPDVRALHTRALHEMAELAQAMADGDRGETLAEAADVAILLHRIAFLAGGDLMQAVDGKMQVNRARLWRRNGDGTGAHIDPKT